LHLPATVIALRGKDEFNLIIPYVRFVPHEVDVPLVVVDTVCLIDGRIRQGFVKRVFSMRPLVIPHSSSTSFSGRGFHGSAPAGPRSSRAGGSERTSSPEALGYPHPESEVTKRSDVDAKLVFSREVDAGQVAHTDYNLAKVESFTALRG